MKKYDFITKKLLLKEYKVEPIEKIAKKLGCSRKAIRNRLKKYNIPVRTIDMANRLENDCKITKQFLLRKYNENKKTMSQIAKELDCSEAPIRNRLIRHNIHIRTFSEILINKLAKNIKNHPSYLDGRASRKYYCINCDKRISVSNGIYGQKKCRSCASRLNWKNKDYRNSMACGRKIRYNGIAMRSSYEIKFAYFLDLSGIKWLYESKAFDLKHSTYIPDFYIPEWDCYIEIKGWWRKDAKEKFRLFKKQYLKTNIVIINKNKLEKLGVL